MTKFVLIIAAIAVTLSASAASSETAGERMDRLFKQCHRYLTQDQFEASGEKLVLVKPADMTKFPPDFLCSGCIGTAGFESFVAEDGSVNAMSNHHTDFRPVDRNGDPPIWKLSVLYERADTIRFEPPRVAGEPVCVAISLDWTSYHPHKFIFSR
jgi:hypothetical protein